MRPWSIRREVSVGAPADAVRAYPGTAEQLSRWWCPSPSVRLAFEPSTGGRFEEHYDDGRLAYHVEGTVTVYEPPRRLAIRRLTPGSPAPSDVIEFTLVEQGSRTRVVLEHCFEGLPVDRRKDMEEYFADAWSQALRALRRLAVQAPGSPADREPRSGRVRCTRRRRR